jgi:flavorubredoxin
MKARRMRDGVMWLGAVDWDRRLFDALIPLPDGTSYNAYLVQGSQKTALLDTVDPTMADVLASQLQTVHTVDYVVSHHAEQDHSGAIPMVLDKYPGATVLCTPKAKGMLIDLLRLPEERFQTVEDGETVSLGDKTLKFIYAPWVHWPETMVTYLPEDQILFTCDFFGSHLATSYLYAGEDAQVYEAAKRYYAEIMMPFRKIIQKNLDKVQECEISLIAPSHGPVYDKPAWIVEAYRDWVSDDVQNAVVIPYISMHGSTEKMVDYLVAALAERDVEVWKFNLAVTDIGKLAMALVDAATIIIGTPTVNGSAHPAVVSAAYLANTIRPKVRYAAIIGTYGWGTKAAEQIAGLIPHLKVEMLGTVMCKGFPSEADFAALNDLANKVCDKHEDLQIKRPRVS